MSRLGSDSFLQLLYQVECLHALTLLFQYSFSFRAEISLLASTTLYCLYVLFIFLLCKFQIPSWVFSSATTAMSFRGLGRANAQSGMGVADHSKNNFMELKLKKMHRYVIFKIDEKKREVVVEKTGGPAETYDDFTASLPENDCRYAVYDFDFVTSENCQKSKIFFIAWSPSSSRIRAKMLYATSKGRLRRELDGVHYEIQATDPTEMDLQVLRDRAH